ncbi:HlyD family efflux transporter periplasmic adaptor subunit [Alkalithermobacter paradoxus]|uniref:HlyD family secretion protein n=1 Tax=Alkalithermobacter paradoxus TaxID=29349 RepID=A0A1V4IAC0_9FIRM|nr:HlyD family secretion protein [[Clostridium] thermoalcaliphilum]
MEKKSKQRKKFRYNYILCLGILTYILVKVVSTISNSTIPVYTVDYGDIVKSMNKECIVIRDEKVIFSKLSGKIDYFVNEGDRLYMNEQIAQVYIKDLDPSVKEKLDTVNRRIEGISANKDEQMLRKDIEKIENNINLLKRELKNKLIHGDIANTQKIKEDLLYLVDKKSLIWGEKSFVGKNLSNLKQEKKILEEKIESSVNTILAENAGVVSFSADGLEEILRLDTLEKLESDYLFSLKGNNNIINKKGEVQVGDAIAKITNNHVWNIAVVLDDKEKDKLPEGRHVDIIKGDIQFSGRVIHLYEDNRGKYIAVIEITEQIDDFHKIRKEKFEIVYKKLTGIKIPKSAVVTEDDKKGVYIISQTGNAVFKELQSILGEDENNIILNYREISTNNIDTVKLYDEIVLTPSRVKQGQKIR